MMFGNVIWRLSGLTGGTFLRKRTSVADTSAPTTAADAEQCSQSESTSDAAVEDKKTESE